MKVDVLDEGRVWQVFAPAKVNLFFEILGKRPDGYHEIETVAAPVSLYDRLVFERVEGRGGLTIECFDENGAPAADIPCDESNLVFKAYRAFCDADSKFAGFAGQTGVLCRVYKKIPSKAGLGGGSSDAAGALLVLNELCGRSVTPERLREIAGGVGSDVALFLEDGASIGRGRGEIVERIDVPSVWLVLLKPSAGLSTPAVYREYASTVHGSQRSLSEFCDRVAAASKLARSCGPSGAELPSETSFEIASTIAKGIFNRLEEPASALWTGFNARREALLSTGALGVGMSGSGTAFFAIYPSETTAHMAADAALRAILESSEPDREGERAYVVRTL